MKRKFLLALASIAAAFGMLFTSTVPAQAVTLSRVAYCNWPYKATVQVYNHTGSGKMTAYSPTGWKLGTYYFSGGAVWHTPWEDVHVFVSSSDPAYNITHHCRP